MGKLPALRPRFRLGGGVTLVRAPPSNHLPPYLAFRRIRNHILSTDGRDGLSTPCGPQVSDKRECKQFVLYHVTSQIGWSATAHISTTFTTAWDILCYQGCITDHQNETHPQRHQGFHLESSGLSLFNMVSGRAVAMDCVSQTDMGKNRGSKVI